MIAGDIGEYQLLCRIIAIVLNVPLIVIINNRLLKSLGNYRYFLVYGCSIHVCFSIVGIIVKTNVRCLKSDFIIYPGANYLSEEQNMFLLVLHLGFYAILLFLEPIRFIHRYSVVNFKVREIFDKTTVLYMAIFLPFTGSILFCWILSSYFINSETNPLYILSNDLKIQTAALIGLSFRENWDCRSTKTMKCIVLLYLIQTTLFSTNFILAFKCYGTLQKIPRLSRKTLNLQFRILRGLLIQLALPFICVHIPLTTMAGDISEYQLFCRIIAIVLNIPLIVITNNGLLRTLGNYRYFLAYGCSIHVCFSIVGIFVRTRHFIEEFAVFKI
ncbi:unnamed protein product [Caenorhabditis angaria]|uniref:G-protein coupled receptors family 1 profile domain-containing protein n=1 Tax=Caenorhabditis angaria TaxID=860376 RepID=A0A9P1J4K3_9PELO|nr:unnamed protein product [Caenorhabditis angaria]